MCVCVSQWFCQVQTFKEPVPDGRGENERLGRDLQPQRSDEQHSTAGCQVRERQCLVSCGFKSVARNVMTDLVT